MNQVEVKRQQIQLCSYVLGFISIWILGKSVGDNGIAYLAMALQGFYILWCITGKYVAESLGRMLRSKSIRGQYKNGAKMRRNIMLQQCVCGFLGSIVFLACTGLLSERLFRMPYSRFLMLLLAPVIFIKTVSAVLTGYFQGNGSELPTAVSAILRQILFLGFAILFGNMLKEYGQKVSALLKQDAFTSMYGGVGIVLAILLTELLLTLFLFLVYKGTNRAPKANNERE